MELKHCTACNSNKPLDEFAYKNKNKGTRQSRCKSCLRNNANEYYKNSANRRKQIRDKFKKNRIIGRTYIQEYKEKRGCSNCGKMYPHYILDFHHIIKKDMEISWLLIRGSSLKRIVKEIEKCIILCANCHRQLHFEKNNGLLN